MNANKQLTRYIFIILLSNFHSAGFCQLWPKIYGDNVHAYGKDIIEGYDKGYNICGSILKDASHFKYGWLIKTDINGNELWNKKFGDGSLENSFYDFDKTNDNGFILSGSTAQYDVEIDPLIVKLNPCGEIDWCTIFLSPGFNTANGIINLPNGEFLGMLQYYGGNYATIRISLVKMDAQGNPIWIKHLAQEDSTVTNEEGKYLYLTPDSNYLISGRCFSPSQHPYFIKTDTNGNEIWDIKWNYGHLGYANRTIFKNNETTYSTSGFQFTGTPIIPYLLKFSQDGEIINQYPLLSDTIEGGGSDALYLDEDTNFFIGVNWTDDPYLYTGYSDIIKTDTNGNLKIQRRLVDNLLPARAIIKTFDSKLLILGYYVVDGNWDIYLWKMNTDLEDDTLNTQPMTYDSLCPFQITSDTVALDCGLFVNIDEIPTQEEYESSIKISPNPAREWVALALPDVLAQGKVELAVYDVFGRDVWTGRNGDNEARRPGVNLVSRTLSLDVSGFAAGMYIAVVKDQNNRRYTGKFVVTK
jgi:hypothetical protein